RVRRDPAGRRAPRAGQLEVGRQGDEWALRPHQGRREPVHRRPDRGQGLGRVRTRVPARRARVGRARDVRVAHDPDHHRGRAGRAWARGISRPDGGRVRAHVPPGPRVPRTRSRGRRVHRAGGALDALRGVARGSADVAAAGRRHGAGAVAHRARARVQAAAGGGMRRAEAVVVAALAAAALVAALLVPTYPTYDTYFHLVWGRELLHGIKPDFEAYAAPTQHPLFLALCAVVGLVGTDADRVLVIICVLSMVALVWGTFRVGEACFGLWPGLLGAAFVGSSFAFLLYAARAYVDMPFLALVVWAAAMEARAPRRGTSVMVVLMVAGLLRPEAWVLAGAYWLWGGWGAPTRSWRFDLLALAVAAPLAWCLVDLIVTGDPLFSLHSTSDLADELNRNRGLSSVP